MRFQGKVKSYFKFTGAMLLLVLAVVAFAYKSSKPLPTRDIKSNIVNPVNNIQPLTKKKVTGASCCKAPSSRSALLSLKKTDKITSPGK